LLAGYTQNLFLFAMLVASINPSGIAAHKKTGSSDQRRRRTICAVQKFRGRCMKLR